MPIPPKLTVLSFGGGQDSTAILHRLLNDDKAREEWAPEDLLVVISDTGDEHPATYAHVARTAKLVFQEHGIPFAILTGRPDLWWGTYAGDHLLHCGYHYDNWAGLREFYERTNTVGSKAFPKSCTDKLKIQPIYKYLSDFVYEHYTGCRRNGKYRGKQPLVDFAKRHGKIRMLIGIAAGEERRIAKTKPDDNKKPTGPVWMEKAIDRRYPLVDWGWDRAGCQKYLGSIGVTVPPPSNCMLCPYMSMIELVWLYRFHPADYAEWVTIEANKLEANKDKGDKNLGVWGKKTLPEVLDEALKKHGHLTKRELQEYKMSHGHCVMSKY